MTDLMIRIVPPLNLLLLPVLLAQGRTVRAIEDCAAATVASHGQMEKSWKQR